MSHLSLVDSTDVSENYYKLPTDASFSFNSAAAFFNQNEVRRCIAIVHRFGLGQRIREPVPYVMVMTCLCINVL